MKNRLLTPTVICLTTFLMFWVFLGFWNKEKEATAFQSIAANQSLSFRHLFIPPEQLGIDTWKIGGYSKYRLRTNIYSKDISFHVAAAVDDVSPRKWLRTSGIRNINGTDVEVWRPLNTTAIHPGSSKEQVLFANGMLPFYTQQKVAVPYPVHLEYVGEVDVKTVIGTFKCQHYFALLVSPTGHYEPLLELWANASVPPLGIVRARWRDEVLELVETQVEYPFEVPEMLAEMMSWQDTKNAGTHIRHSKSECSNCHDGTHLKQETLLAVRGEKLDVTESLYHYRRSDLFRPDNLLGLRLRPQHRKHPVSDEIRFTWGKGSFKVKSGILGQIVVSLDESAYEGNIHVAADKGTLILNPAVKPY